MKKQMILGSLGTAIVAVAVWQAALAQPPSLTAVSPPPPPRPAGGYKRIVGPETMNPGEWPQHWPYADEYDAVAAAPEPHYVLYADAKVRLVDVGYFPGIKGKMHGHPFPSVFANDSPGPPNDFNVNLDPERQPDWGHGKPIAGTIWPTCNTMGPQAPHAETNQDNFPHHFFRVEYRRVDGKAVADHWRDWYPAATRPAPKATSVGPQADAVVAAPGNYRVLFENDHIRFVEVLLRPGETEPMHADLYPAVLAIDTADAKPAIEDRPLDPKSARNGQGTTISDSPKISPQMRCDVVPARAPHAMHNAGAFPVHYYRIEFKRIDGDGLKTHWREWYPRMAKYETAYAQTPWVLNY